MSIARLCSSASRVRRSIYNKNQETLYHGCRTQISEPPEKPERFSFLCSIFPSKFLKDPLKEKASAKQPVNMTQPEAVAVTIFGGVPECTKSIG